MNVVYIERPDRNKNDVAYNSGGCMMVGVINDNRVESMGRLGT